MEYIHNNKLYHRSLIFIGCMIWGFSDIIALSLGLLEIKPEIHIRDSNGDLTYTGPLNYRDCDKEYTIISMNKNSLVNYFGIYCNKYLVAMIASSGFFGVFLGTVIAPFIYDNYGRRKPIIISSLFNSIIILLSTFSRSIYELYIFIFFYGLTNLLSHLAIFIVISEVTHKHHRATSSMVVFNSFSLFGIIFSLMFKYFEDWKTVFRIDFLCTLGVSLLTYFFVKESPRYLLLKGDIKFKQKMLAKVYNYGKESLYTANIVQEDCEEILLQKETLGPSSTQSQPISILLTNNNIRWVFISMSFMWFCISGSYYAIMILMKDAKGNLYYIYMFMYVFEIVANILSGIMMENPCLGRTKSLTLLYSGAIIMILAIMLFQYSGLATIFMIVLRFFISMMYNINYVYSTEFYPTDIRARGFALNAVFGRIGAILTPFLV